MGQQKMRIMNDKDILDDLVHICDEAIENYKALVVGGCAKSKPQEMHIMHQKTLVYEEIREFIKIMREEE